MFKLFIALLTLIPTTTLAASFCTDDTVDSKYFEINTDGVEKSYADSETAQKVIIKATGCPVNLLNLTSTKCLAVDEDTFPVCVVKSHRGFYTVSFDYLEIAHIVFARWD